MAYTFADLFEHSVDAMPDRLAMIVSGEEVTYRELDDRANRLAHHLESAGFGVGAHIGVHMHNSIETMVAIIAAFKIRAIPLTVNFRYTSDELRYLYDNADLEVLVFHQGFADRVAEVLPEVPRIRHLISVPDELATGVEGAVPGAVAYEDALAGSSPQRGFGERSPDDHYIFYTGGTTGRPKGVVWRHEDIWRVLGGGLDFYTGEPVTDEFQQSRGGVAAGVAMRWVMLPPLIHTSAMMPTFTAFFTGNTVIMEPKFDATRVWEVVAEYSPQVMVITGDAMGRPLVEAFREQGRDTSSLGVVASGAALFSAAVKDAFFEAMPNLMISDSVGSSETGFGGIGFATKGFEQHGGPKVGANRYSVVVDDENRILPSGSGGEGWLAKLGNVPVGYYKDPVKSAEIFRIVEGQRAVVTGDRARIEDDGSITLLGRGNMVINTGGEKVFAEEVEAAVKAHPDIYDAIVIGVPDERWGSRVAAVMRVRDGVEPDFESIEKHARNQLAGYKIPRTFWIADEVIRTPSGKPDFGWAREHASANDHAYRID
ncbi:acyl-CoA synthetase [Prescottella agglutinans]|uniref:Acyl-CoA synthetase (AMP-forming)/AMP-acid ligase II n=1 Tax=Prescottella agglutinans TaxID=1644129 RepID=A0ABT6MIA9_9NOCA|nr:acyl-CoA synthetase [Prescottella agglutinans]MDH6283059.1 acyl-CoA synthetase (AMP-forming)/AMP-acid ligase II [Prescottella agglutinans]